MPSARKPFQHMAADEAGAAGEQDHWLLRRAAESHFPEVALGTVPVCCELIWMRRPLTRGAALPYARS